MMVLGRKYVDNINIESDHDKDKDDQRYFYYKKY